VSNDEQDAALLRLVKTRGAAKRQKSLLETELRAAGTSLYNIGAALRSIGFSTSVQETPGAILQHVATAPDICGLERVKAMLEELKELNETLKQLTASAITQGID
jgi:hypothetical protein